MPMGNPANTAGVYPILGLLHLLSHPKTVTGPLRQPSQLLFPTILKTLLFTCLLTGISLFTLYHITNHALYLIARNIALPPFPWIAKNALLRSAITIIGVSVQAAFLAAKIVQYYIGSGAKKLGFVVLQLKGAGDIIDSSNPLGTATGVLSTTGAVSSITNSASDVSSSVQSSVTELATNPKGAAVSVEKKLEQAVSKKGLQWAAKKAISIPAETIPIAGPILYAVLNATELGEDYILDYAKSAGVEREVEMNKGSVQAFGVVAGMLQAIPIVGPVFSFSNFVGSALWVSDMKAYKSKH